ncbi:MAG: FKBP-type peptidyl-prolyl cis-trans isomerase [Bacteroidales bacterium]|jgi:FKBP-type peptidyl-prolyl cis-trans isomerase|nr:FKBP-type peptidyl-prolyl cis-trans isomerase [Bacteroidales bacterium]
MRKTILTLLLAFAAQSLIAQNPLEGYTKSDAGVWYKFEKRNDKGTPVKEGDIIIGQASIKLGDSLTMNGFMYPAQPIFMATMKQNVFKGDLMEGLFLMKAGEVCTFAFPYDSIGKAMQLPPFFKQEEYAYFRVSIDSLTTEEAMRKADSINYIEQSKLADSLEKEESGKIAKYLKEKGYSNEAVNGVYLHHISKGSEAKPDSTDNVKVNYVGRFLDGKLFDTSVEEVAKAEGMHQQGRAYEPLAFTIGRRMMIDGFERGVKMMNEGGKAIVVIPSALAYGGQQRGEIPPFSPLVFEIELVSIEKAIDIAPAPKPAQTIKVEPKTK